MPKEADRQWRRGINHRIAALEKIKIGENNLENYYQDLIQSLEGIVTEVILKYRQDVLNRTDLTPPSKQEEDAAFDYFHLHLIDFLLERAAQVQRIEVYLQEHTVVPQVLLPPDESKIERTHTGATFETAKYIPRLQLLTLLLLEKLGIAPEDLVITTGSVFEKMVRKLPYHRVEIPGVPRVIYICNEEKNTTFVFDTEKLAALNISLAELDLFTKDELKLLIKNQAHIGTVIRYRESWQSKLVFALQNEIPVVEKKSAQLNLKDTNRAIPYPTVENAMYWVDSFGRTWATPHSLHAILGIDEKTLRKYIADHAATLQTTELAIRNNLWTAYCIEEVREISEIDKLINSPKVETEGAWKGYNIDSLQQHWATLQTLLLKIRKSGPEVKAIIAEQNLRSQTVLNSLGIPFEMYCLEEIVKGFRQKGVTIHIHDSSQELDPLEWPNFIQDERGIWGDANAISAKSGIPYDECFNILSRNPQLQKEKMRTATNSRFTFHYLYQEFIVLSETEKYLNSVKPNGSDMWTGYYVENDLHYASEYLLAQKFGFDNGALSRKGLTAGLRKKDGQISGIVTLLCEEDLLNHPDFIKWNAGLRVISSGEGRGFHIDNQGQHFSNTTQLGIYFGVSVDKIEGVVKKRNLKAYDLSYKSLKVGIGYCLEDLAEYLAPKN